MKILWIVNIELPEASELLKRRQTMFGGWLVEYSKMLSEYIELYIACPSKTEPKWLIGDKIKYILFNQTSSDQKIRKLLADSILKIKPDIIHIHGTEYKHSLIMNELGNEMNIPTVVSIQGLVSVISEHLYADLPLLVTHTSTIRNFIMKDNIRQLKKQFYKRGLNEIQLLKNTKNVIGRTDWDKSQVKLINKNINYFHCDEMLRKSFYTSKWTYEKCERYSIFISQAGYSLKGLHYLINAINIIKNDFPGLRVYIGGKDYSSRKFKDKLYRTRYNNYILKLIRKYGLSSKFIFTGLLNEEEVKNRILTSNIVISPSTIENSSNSVSEALLLGAPVIASYVGGTPSLIDSYFNGILYQHNDYKMLASLIYNIFQNQISIHEITKNAYLSAHNRHDKFKIVQRTLEIYENVKHAESKNASKGNRDK